MITFDKFTLDNGLKVIVHNDNTTPLVAVNILYDVGARDEDPDKTGFAHLFEHLMFGGSANIPFFDKPLQLVGGENNAFTNNDITNYYITLPKSNIETAFWLESDRMLELDFSEKNLDVQRKVVIEEYKQRYLTTPYSDVWLHLRPLAYHVHPYQWATIGKDISHIENATLEDVKTFFYKYYAPNNAILTVTGNITTQEVEILAKKWFAQIPIRQVPIRNLPQEPTQQEFRYKQTYNDVPYDAIYKVFHMCERLNSDYSTTDLISDILSNGDSTRLYQNLVKERNLFAEIDAHISGSIDAGLFIINGKLVEGVSIQEAEDAIDNELEKIKNEIVDDYELQKVKNKYESTLIYSEINILNKAMNLSYYENLGDANLINTELNNYINVTSQDIKRVANKIFTKENQAVLYYMKNKTDNE